jgi:nucleoside 2-deoxyribosyltransferase
MTNRIRVYCASPAHRAKMWTVLAYRDLHIVSTWHNNPTLASDDLDHDTCRDYWEIDFAEIRKADALLAYAEHKDRPNGTLIEIGYALAHDTPVALVGNFEWGTWRHLPLVTHYATLREAVAGLTGVSADDPT